MLEERKRRKSYNIFTLLLTTILLLAFSAQAFAWSDYGDVTHLKKRSTNDRRSVEWWNDNLYQYYWPKGYFDEYFVSHAVRKDIQPVSSSGGGFFGTGLKNGDGLWEIRHYNQDHGEVVYWSWWKPYHNKTASGPDDYDLYWSWMEYALADPTDKKDVWIDEKYEFLVGVDCGNINKRGNHPTIYGYKFEDIDGNGKLDQGEPKLNDWTIQLYYGNKITPVKNHEKTANLTAKTRYESSKGHGYFKLDLQNRENRFDYTESFYLKEEPKDGWKQTTANPPVITITDQKAFSQSNDFGTYYFGNFELGIIKGTKFEDMNGDGARDILKDPGIPGWKIYLYKEGNSNPIKTVLTDSKGNYQFDHLHKGTYIVKEEHQANWKQTYPENNGYHKVTVSQSGQVFKDRNFGNFELGKIKGIKFHDKNKNGQKDADENNLSGWKIQLFPQGSSTLIKETTTDQYGNYQFEGLDLGKYTVKEVQQYNWIQTKPPNNAGYNVEIRTSGQVISGCDFGNFNYGLIEGIKFYDMNNNRLKDSREPVLSGWQINLRKYNPSTKLFEPYKTKWTDTTGRYLFDYLDFGTYRVYEVVQDGWKQTFPNPSVQEYYEVKINEGGIRVSNRDFGNFNPARIEGYKFKDENKDGSWDKVNEPVKVGWDILLFKVENGVETLWGSTKTDSDGRYVFDDLCPGTYRVKEICPFGWEQTKPVEPDYYEVIISSLGQIKTGYDFGNWHDDLEGTISGVKFKDVNKNGKRENEEKGIKWEVRLFQLQDGQWNLLKTVYTDSAGYYEFINLPVGFYRISEKQEPGWEQTMPVNPEYYDVIINEIEKTITGRDFGNFAPNSITGVKFEDLDKNGERNYDPISKFYTEPGLLGWTIELYRQNPLTEQFEFLENIKTDISGSYRFDGLISGTYRVQEVRQDGWEQTRPVNPPYYIITINDCGQVFPGYDFGNFSPSVIEGVKFEDIDKDGERDFDSAAGKFTEPGLEGWTIQLFRYGEETPFRETLTDSNGKYRFDELLPGLYNVREVPQEGWEQTTPGGNNHIAFITKCNETLSGYDFGNCKLGKIEGIKFEDVNQDGTRAYDTAKNIFTEPGLPSWEINLFKLNNETGYYEFDRSSVTDENGYYSFNNLSFGKYRVEETTKNGWIQIVPPEQDNYYVEINRSGQEVTGCDFGNFALGVIEGVKFNDLNANALKEEGEELLPGWTIQLFREGEETPLAESITEENGAYRFEGLDTGLYVVKEIPQDGWMPSTPLNPDSHTVEIRLSGQVESNKDFGNFIPNEIEGVKFEDFDKDGTRDYDAEKEEYIDTGIAEWTIELYKLNPANNELELMQTAVTDKNGYYRFGEIGVGTYRVKEVIPGKWVQTAPSNPGYYDIVFDETGKVVQGKDFGNFYLGVVAGVKFEDYNINGERDIDIILGTDLEPLLAGWTMQIYRYNPETGEEIFIGATLTDEKGRYLFEGLDVGLYHIKEVQQEGWKRSRPATRDYYEVKIEESHQAVFGADFGNYIPGVIEGIKYIDNDKDGIRDYDIINNVYTDAPKEGWKIFLYRGNDTEPYRTAVTGAEGKYRFDNLDPGTYLVKEEQLAGWVQTAPAGSSYTVTIDHSGQVEMNKDFGNFELGIIEGIKFEDMKKDGSKAGDPVKQGWAIYLYKNGGTEPFKTAVTDVEGKYSFTDLDLGTYTVREEQRAGWVQTAPAGGSYTVTIDRSSQVEKDKDFGNFKLGIIEGIKFEDMKKDGSKVGDPAKEGWTIYLYRTGETQPYKSAVTDSEGKYSFTALDLGTYTVKEEQRVGWVQTAPAGGSYAITIDHSSQVEKDKDFGNFKLGIIEGIKFEDMKKDGSKLGDPAKQGWTIYLYRTGEAEPIKTAVTDAEGKYSFADLDLGTYTLKEKQVDGWVQTAPQAPDYYTVVIDRSSQVEKDKDFGNFKLGLVGGIKFWDKSGNGVYEPETEELLDGWVMQLYAVDQNGNETLLREAVTGSNPAKPGWYFFDNLDIGKYRIKEVCQPQWLQTYPATEDRATGILTPLSWDFEITTSSFEDTSKNFGNWFNDYSGKTKGWWMHIYDPDKKPPNPDSELWHDYQNRQQYLDYINEHSTVLGDEVYGFGKLTVDNVWDILQTNDAGTGATTEHAMNLMESQFVTTWLNIAAGYIKWDANVFLYRVPDYDESLFDGNVVPISQIIAITEEAVKETFEFQTGWGHSEYIGAHEVYTFINEAENTQGAPFRPYLATQM